MHISVMLAYQINNFVDMKYLFDFIAYTLKKQYKTIGLATTQTLQFISLLNVREPLSPRFLYKEVLLFIKVTLVKIHNHTAQNQQRLGYYISMSLNTLKNKVYWH